METGRHTTRRRRRRGAFTETIPVAALDSGGRALAGQAKGEGSPLATLSL
jgi:hypothetical protein